ncbi:MAG: aspartate aminotransferase family protein [Chthoniobacteraceae bacterium]
MPLDLKSLVATRLGENYTLHERHLNPTLVSVQRIIGFDQVYARAQGAWLYDLDEHAYLDFLSGYSVFNIGRNHPAVQQAIRDVLALDLPNMVQMDCSLLSGLLAEALLKRFPAHLDAVFFCNSGAEAVEGALKFARAATRRSGLLSFTGSFHGLTHGALSVMGDDHFREGFGPLLAGAECVPFGDLAALGARLARRDVAALIIEPVQGKGVHFPDGNFFREAQRLCRDHGTLLISDEVQTGLGRTGRWWGFEHWDLEPDIVTVAKSLSGGYVPCAAVVSRRAVQQATFSRLDRCVVHSSTFGRNNLAMACGLATLEVIADEDLVARAHDTGMRLLDRLTGLKQRHSLIKEVRGLGMMIAIEFHEPRELAARMGWKLLHRFERELFAQMIVTALFTKHRILTQLAGHDMDVIKILPPLIIGEREIDYFVSALDAVLTDCGRFPGPIWDLGANFVKHTLRRPAAEPAEAG